MKFNGPINRLNTLKMNQNDFTHNNTSTHTLFAYIQTYVHALALKRKGLNIK